MDIKLRYLLLVSLALAIFSSCQNEIKFERVEYEKVTPLDEGNPNSPTLTYRASIDWPEEATPKLKRWILIPEDEPAKQNVKAINIHEWIEKRCASDTKWYKEKYLSDYNKNPNKAYYTQKAGFSTHVLYHSDQYVSIRHCSTVQYSPYVIARLDTMLHSWSVKQEKVIKYEDVFLPGQELLLRSQLSKELVYKIKSQSLLNKIRQGLDVHDFALLKDSALFCCFISEKRMGFVEMKVAYKDILPTLTDYAKSLLGMNDIVQEETSKAVPYVVGSKIPIIDDPKIKYKIISAEITDSFSHEYSKGYKITYIINPIAKESRYKAPEYLFIKLVSTKGQIINCEKMPASQREQMHALHEYDFEGKSKISHIEYITEEECRYYLNQKL